MSDSVARPEGRALRKPIAATDRKANAMDINYRRAKLEDIDVLVDFRLRFLADRAGTEKAPAEDLLGKYLRDYFAEAMPRRAFIAWLAERDGDVVATSGLVVWRMPPNNSVPTGRQAYVLNMYTMPEARRQGICTALLEKMIEEARALGLSRVHLHASKTAEGIYRRRGFVEPSDVELLFRLD
jgi:GNAT superfamily N-acetyltransferase